MLKWTGARVGAGPLSSWLCQTFRERPKNVLLDRVWGGQGWVQMLVLLA